MPRIFGREPARWVGLFVTIILAVLRVLVGDELISPDQADGVANAVQKVADVVLLLLPLIGNEVLRRFVTPVQAPALPEGTTVKVVTPPGEPDRRVTV
jgi:hypothetical protein